MGFFLAQHQSHFKEFEPMANIPLLCRTEAAAYLCISPKTLESDVTRKRLHIPFVRLGRAVRYRLSDLNNWIESNIQK
jgi:excisionase family DNA binding protein